MLAFPCQITLKFTMFMCFFYFRHDENEDTVVTDTVVANYSINTFYHFELCKTVMPNKH